jgi:outer membrane receptor protein involved in Fe transport
MMKVLELGVTAACLALAGAAQALAQDPVFPLPPLEVRAAAAAVPATAALSGLQVELVNPAGNPAALLQRLPGVALQSRGPNALDPVVRGLSGDRLTTRFNGLLLPGAAPTETAAAVNFLGNSGLHTLRLVRALPSVTSGAGNAGGQLLIESPAQAAPVRGAWLAHDSASRGNEAGARLDGEWGGLVLQSAAGYRAGADYRAGNGAKVDADHRARELALTGRYAIDGSRSLSWAGQLTLQDLARNPSLPLDTANSESAWLTLDYTVESGGVRWRWQAGYGEVEQRLSSADRPIAANAPIRLVEARSPMRTFRLAATRTRQLGEQLEWACGLDFDRVERDALRQRHLLSGATLRDRLWPDVRETRPGGFVELSGGGADDVPQWRVGARVERARAAAGALDDPVVGVPGARGATIRENFIAFNGPAAAGGSTAEWTGAANMVVAFPLQPGLRLTLGAGGSRSPAGIGSRYRTFLNALGGGVEVGNPALRPERRRELTAAIEARRGRLSLQAAGYIARVNGHVVRRVVEDSPLVFGFRNTDARFHGWELTSQYEIANGPGYQLLLSGFHARVFGEDRATGARLAELPPWQAGGGLRLLAPGPAGPLRAELRARASGAGRNPDPANHPLQRDTAAYLLWDFALGVHLHPQVRLSIELENLADKAAWSFLQAPVDAGLIGPSSGDLRPGDAIPLPGRTLRLRIDASF